ncbi:hypothetical protein SBV1_520018 [Verrucomicrobia bacterium]|nr:hypothetical protein SBV1_520018 [Verrucomicrobiota bacterium]
MRAAGEVARSAQILGGYGSVEKLAPTHVGGYGVFRAPLVFESGSPELRKLSRAGAFGARTPSASRGTGRACALTLPQWERLAES